MYRYVYIYLLRTTFDILPTTFSPLPTHTAYDLLPTAYYLLPTTSARSTSSQKYVTSRSSFCLPYVCSLVLLTLYMFFGSLYGEMFETDQNQ